MQDLYELGAPQYQLAELGGDGMHSAELMGRNEAVELSGQSVRVKGVQHQE